MKGLLIKDYYMLMKYFRTYVVIIGVMAIVTLFSTPAPLFIIYPVIMTNMLPVSLVNYDEMSRFDRYYQTMPISKTQYVSSKYLMSLIFQILSLIIFMAAYSISLIRSSQFEAVAIMTIASYMIILASVLPSILLPFVFKFGSEKGRMFYLLITAIFVGASMYLLNNDTLLMIDMNTIGFVRAFIMSMLIYGISWFISIKIYKKREIA